MSADTKPPPTLRTNSAQSSHAMDLVVFALVGANAATQFAIQAWMSYEFARQVWRIPGLLCVAVIVALDLFVTVFMALTYLLRDANRAKRAYAWLILFAGIGAQLFAAELFARHERWTTPVECFAALPALFLASSLHGLIIYRNHRAATDGQGREDDRVADGSLVAAHREFELHASTASEKAAGRAPVTIVTPRPTRPPQVPPVASGRRSRRAGDDVTGKARELIREGRSCAEVATIVGKSKRWVEVATKDVRATLRSGESVKFTQAETGDGWRSFPKGDGSDQPEIS